MQRRAFLAGLGATGLAACSAEPVWAPEDVVRAKAFVGGNPPALRLFTMRNTGSDSGAHTGLLVDASQRVIFDPAGTFGHPTIPERNDVLFGINPRVERFYVSYHARITYYVEAHRVVVPATTAERALQLVLQAGPVPKANCTRVTSQILRQLPGFQSLPQTWFPASLSDAFGRLPGVETEVFRESDSDDKSLAILQFDMQQATAGQ